MREADETLAAGVPPPHLTFDTEEQGENLLIQGATNVLSVGSQNR